MTERRIVSARLVDSEKKELSYVRTRPLQRTALLIRRCPRSVVQRGPREDDYGLEIAEGWGERGDLRVQIIDQSDDEVCGFYMHKLSAV